MNIRAFGSSGFIVPILSTYSVLREPKPIATPSLNRQSVHESAVASHETPMSRDFSHSPGRAPRQCSMTQSIHSRCGEQHERDERREPDLGVARVERDAPVVDEVREAVERGHDRLRLAVTIRR
jgi:hypothetical protein